MQNALRDLMPLYGVPIGPPVELATLFATPVPTVLEIGCGMGDATLAMARAEPDRGILAVDVHTRGIAALLLAINEERLPNLRVAHGDAVTLVEAMPPDSLAGIRVWFPDPWPKVRHHKRRLLQAPAVELLASRLAVGATLHVATDWAEYADEILAALDAEPRLANPSGGFAPRPGWRPVTRYEQAGRDAGRVVADVIAVRV